MDPLPSQPLPGTLPAARSGRWKGLLVLVAGVLLTPLFLLVVLFPWLSQQAFRSIEDLKAEELEEVRVQLLNHPERKPDVGPVALGPAAAEPILALLRNAERIPELPPSAMLGELRIRFLDGRRGTVRLRFQPANSTLAEAPVWMEIGSQKYRVGTFGTLWATAEAAATQGQPVNPGR